MLGKPSRNKNILLVPLKAPGIWVANPIGWGVADVIGTLEQGERVRVGRPVTLQIQGKNESLRLK